MAADFICGTKTDALCSVVRPWFRTSKIQEDHCYNNWINKNVLVLDVGRYVKKPFCVLRLLSVIADRTAW